MRRREWEREFLEGEGLLKMPVSLASGPLGGLSGVLATRPGQGEHGFGGTGLAPWSSWYYQNRGH